MQGPLSLPSKEDILIAKIRQIVPRLYKAQLDRLDEITDRHDEAMSKLMDHLPEEYKKYVILADYLSEEVCETNRRNVLREGNNAVRDLEEVVKSLMISDNN